MMQTEFTKIMEEKLLPLDLGTFHLPEECGTPPVRGLSISPHDRLLFILSGVKREFMACNGKIQKIELKKGDFYLIRKNIWEQAAFDSAHELFCIVPHGGFLRLSYYPITVPQQGHSPWPKHLYLHTQGIPPPLLDTLRALSSEEALADPETAKLCARLAIRLALGEARRSSPPAGRAQRLFEEVSAYLVPRIGDPPTREECAREFSITPQYLSRLFRNFSGHSFSETVSEGKLLKARQLLENTVLPVKTIAYECGFSDPAYFNRRFRERYGVTPLFHRFKYLRDPGAESSGGEKWRR